MGNLCSKSANKDSDNFAAPGRVLGNANASGTNNASSTPVPQKLTTSTPGRTLGAGEGAASSGDARSAAAKAAEERAARMSKPGSGKLATQLAEQKRQTQNQTLNAGSEANRLARDADANTETRNWN